MDTITVAKIPTNRPFTFNFICSCNKHNSIAHSIDFCIVCNDITLYLSNSSFCTHIYHTIYNTALQLKYIAILYHLDLYTYHNHPALLFSTHYYHSTIS